MMDVGYKASTEFWGGHSQKEEGDLEVRSGWWEKGSFEEAMDKNDRKIGEAPRRVS